MSDAVSPVGPPARLTDLEAWDVFTRLPLDVARLTVSLMPAHTLKKLRQCSQSLRRLVGETVTRATASVAADPLPALGVVFPCLDAISLMKSDETTVADYNEAVLRQLSGGHLAARLSSLLLSECVSRPVLLAVSALPRLHILCVADGVRWSDVGSQPCATPQPAITQLRLRFYPNLGEPPLLLPAERLQHVRHLVLRAYPRDADADLVLAAVVLLPLLERLNLDDVALHPHHVPQLQQLRRLRDLSCLVEDPFEPSLRQLGQLRALTALTVRTPWFTAIEEPPQHWCHHLTELRSLRRLNIGEIVLWGTALQLLQLTKLQALRCGGFDGRDDPARMAVATSLRELECLSRPGDALMRRLRTAEGRPTAHMTKLSIVGGGFCAGDVGQLAAHTGLRELRFGLRDNTSDACFAESLGQLTRLTQLALPHLANISGAGLRVIGTLSRLAVLKLGDSGLISGTALAAVVLQLPVLQCLMLGRLKLIKPQFLHRLLRNIGTTSLRDLRFLNLPLLSETVCRRVLDEQPEAHAQLVVFQVNFEYLIGSGIPQANHID